MATTSFDKSFVVKDEASIKKFKRDAKSPVKVVVKKRNYNTDKTEGIGLLKQQLSNLETC